MAIVGDQSFELLAKTTKSVGEERRPRKAS